MLCLQKSKKGLTLERGLLSSASPAVCLFLPMERRFFGRSFERGLLLWLGRDDGRAVAELVAWVELRLGRPLPSTVRIRSILWFHVCPLLLLPSARNLCLKVAFLLHAVQDRQGDLVALGRLAIARTKINGPHGFYPLSYLGTKLDALL